MPTEMNQLPMTRSPHDDRPGLLLNRAVSALNNEVSKALAPFGVSGAQWAVLWRLSDDEAWTPAQISRAVGINTGAMSRLLSRMVAADLIVTHPDARDGRRLVVERTAKAREIHPALTAAVKATDESVFAGVSDRDVSKLVNLLRQMLANTGDAERDGSRATEAASQG